MTLTALESRASSATTAPHAFGDAARVAPGDAAGLARLEVARRYLAAIEADTAGGEIDGAFAFYHPDVVQVEMPNRLVPSGAQRDLAALRDAAARGRGVMRGQRYEVRAAYAVGDTVILELLWVGTLAVPIGALAAGDEMRAHFAVVLEFGDGLIIGQRNYDCFEPF